MEGSDEVRVFNGSESTEGISLLNQSKFHSMSSNSDLMIIIIEIHSAFNIPRWLSSGGVGVNQVRK